MNSEPTEELETPKHITDIEIGQHVHDEVTDKILKFEKIHMHENIFVGEGIRLAIPNAELPSFQDRFTFVEPPEEKTDATDAAGDTLTPAS